MKMIDKQQAIMAHISSNLFSYEKYAAIVLQKHYKMLSNKNDHKELVSAVLFGIYGSDKNVDKFYGILIEGKLSKYITTAIYHNGNSFKAPFLRKKKLDRLLKEIRTDGNLYDVCNTEEETYTDEEQLKIDKVNHILTGENSKDLFMSARITQDQWRYFRDLVVEY